MLSQSIIANYQTLDINDGKTTFYFEILIRNSKSLNGVGLAKPGISSEKLPGKSHSQGISLGLFWNKIMNEVHYFSSKNKEFSKSVVDVSSLGIGVFKPTKMLFLVVNRKVVHTSLLSYNDRLFPVVSISPGSKIKVLFERLLFDIFIAASFVQMTRFKESLRLLI